MTTSRTKSCIFLAAFLSVAILHSASAATVGTSFPLYVSNINNNAIVRLDSSGNQTVFASGGNIQVPFGLAFDSSGNLYVASLANNSIVKLDTAGNQSVFASGGSLNGPTGMAFDANGNLYVSNQYGNNIVKVVSTGEQVVFSSGGSIQTPFALAFDAAGNLYSTSYGDGGSVVKMDSSGNQTVFNVRSVLPSPQGLAFDAAGNLYVSCRGTNNLDNFVVKLDNTGNVIGVFSANGDLNGPANLAFDGLGNLYVANDRGTEVVRITSNASQAIFSSGGSFRTPFGLAFTRLLTGNSSISYSGSSSGIEVNNWRNASVPKTRDIDGDNVYGSWGAINWPNSSPGNTTSFLENITWVLNAAGTQATGPNYALIDQLPSGPTSTTAGTSLGSLTFTFEGAEPDYTGRTMRVGILQDVLDSANWPLDTFKGLQVKQLNGSGDSGVVPLRGGGPGTGSPAFYFFDIYPVHPGDTFSVIAPNNVGGTSGGPGYISAVSFDLAQTAQVQYFPSSLNFGNQQQGISSAPKTVTLTNAGTAVLSISAISTSANFAQTNNCGSSLAPGGSCQVSVTFIPQALGLLSGSLTISDNSAGAAGRQTISLSGIGLSTPILLIDPGSLDFGNQQTSTTSAPKTVILTNNSPAGSAPLAITSFTVTGNFAQTNNCPATLGTGASCQISVTFIPQTASRLSGQMVIKDNAGGAPHTVSLAGTGVGIPSGSLSNASLTFPGQQQGTGGSPQTVTLSNTGGAPLLIASIGLTGSVFSQANNCPLSLAPAGSCQITVTFAPQSIGTFTGIVSITDNNAGVAGSVQTISLSGTGLGTPKVVLSPPSIAFPVVLTGQISAPQTVMLSNAGTGPLNIKSIVLSPQGVFNQSNNCGSTVAQGASCQFTVTFAPVTTGGTSGVIQMIDNDPSGFQNINLSGSGTFFTITPPNLNFGNLQPGVPSAPQTITILNGFSTLTITSITVSPNFKQTNTCSVPLAKGASCQIKVVFTPPAFGSYSGTLTINDQIPGWVPFIQTVPLTGTSMGAVAKLSATSLLFVAGPGRSTTQSVKLSNAGNIALNITSLAMSGRDSGRFTQTNTCGSSLAAGASCTINITYHAPSGFFSSASAVLNILDIASPGTQSISLVGLTL